MELELPLEACSRHRPTPQSPQKAGRIRKSTASLELGKPTQPEATVPGVDFCQRLSTGQRRAVLGRGEGLRMDIRGEREQEVRDSWVGRLHGLAA